MSSPKTYFNWSSGKDSALALYYLQQQKEPVAQLLTSINAHHDRVSMHGVRRALLEQQIAALGLPYTTLELPEEPGMPEYEAILEATVSRLKKEGFTRAAFGDIFLEDLRRYRENQLRPFEISTVFPLWGRDTRELILEFIDLGFKAITVCVNYRLLDTSFCGRIIDRDFVRDLPEEVDPCGENGEFHTFCFDGPVFRRPIPFTIGEHIFREYKAPAGFNEDMGYWFCDLLPATEPLK